MIQVAKVPEPPAFDQEARQPGRAWLAAYPGQGRPRDYWTPFKPQLAEGFRGLCGYAAMCDPTGGTVDHYRSVKEKPELAYEWSNYRFASGLMNSIKRTASVLDPYEVGEGWFEIVLPSLQLVLTDRVPPEFRERAKTTLRRLGLGHDERVLRYRRSWYERYVKGGLTLEGLYEAAPLIAAAVERQLREKMERASASTRVDVEPPESAR